MWSPCGEKSYKFSPNLTELLFNGPAEPTVGALGEAKWRKWRNFYSHAETQRAQSFIRTRIERIDSIFGVHERCLQRCTDH